MNEKGITIKERVEELGGDTDKLKVFLSKELPDAMAYNSYPEKDYLGMLEAIFKAFGEIGVEILQVYVECIMHGGSSC